MDGAGADVVVTARSPTTLLRTISVGLKPSNRCYIASDVASQAKSMDTFLIIKRCKIDIYNNQRLKEHQFAPKCILFRNCGR
jgi:hypothetical protein